MLVSQHFPNMTFRKADIKSDLAVLNVMVGITRSKVIFIYKSSFAKNLGGILSCFDVCQNGASECATNQPCTFWIKSFFAMQMFSQLLKSIYIPYDCNFSKCAPVQGILI